MLKLIQLGLTFTDAEGNLPTCNGELSVWQFNFKCAKIRTASLQLHVHQPHRKPCQIRLPLSPPQLTSHDLRTARIASIAACPKLALRFVEAASRSQSCRHQTV